MRSLAPLAPLSTLFKAMIQMSNAKYIWDNEIYFPKSRFSLEYLFRLFFNLRQRKPKVVFPSFFCREIIASISEYCEQITLQPIDPFEDSTDDFEDFNVSLNCDIYISVDFFGSKRDYKILQNNLKKFNCWLVLDRAHSFDDSLDEKADFILYSYYKTYGCSSGAILKVKNQEYLDSNLHGKIIQKGTNWTLLTKYLLKSIFNISSNYTKDSFSSDSIDNHNNSNRKIGKLEISWMRILKKYHFYDERHNNNAINSEIVELFTKDTVCKIKYIYASVFQSNSAEERNRIVKQLQDVGMMPWTWPNFSWGEVSEQDQRLKSTLFLLPNHSNCGLKATLRKISKLLKVTLEVKEVAADIWEEISSKFDYQSHPQDGNYLSNRNYPAFELKNYLIKWKDLYVAALVCFESKMIELHNVSPVRKNTSNSLLLTLAIKAVTQRRHGIKLIRSSIGSNAKIYSKAIFPISLFSQRGMIRSGFINLSKDSALIENHFNKKWQRELNKARELCSGITLLENFDFESFLKRYINFCETKKFSGVNQQTLTHLISIKNKFHLISATFQGEYIGDVAIYIHGNTATYLIGMSNDKGREFKVNYLLIWKVIEKSIHLNLKFFDLGGFSQFSTGIDHFKKGFNSSQYQTQGLLICLG